MWGTVAGALIAVAANIARVPAAETGPTVWWRTQGAQVLETRDDSGRRSCSLVMDHGADAVVLVWQQTGATSIYVKHRGWQFGDQEGALPVRIEVGDVQLGAGTARLEAVHYKDWIMAPVDQPVADVLTRGPDIHVGFPDGQADAVAFPIDRGRIAALVRAVHRCQKAIGAAR
jgi:hypothetical protein